jgi:hypothetical protein
MQYPLYALEGPRPLATLASVHDPEQCMYLQVVHHVRPYSTALNCLHRRHRPSPSADLFTPPGKFSTRTELHIALDPDEAYRP